MRGEAFCADNHRGAIPLWGATRAAASSCRQNDILRHILPLPPTPAVFDQFVIDVGPALNKALSAHLWLDPSYYVYTSRLRLTDSEPRPASPQRLALRSYARMRAASDHGSCQTQMRR